MIRGISGGQKKRVTTGKSHKRNIETIRIFYLKLRCVLIFDCFIQVRCLLDRLRPFSWMRYLLVWIAPQPTRLSIPLDNRFISSEGLQSYHCFSLLRRLMISSTTSFLSRMDRLCIRVLASMSSSSLSPWDSNVPRGKVLLTSCKKLVS